MSFPKSLDEFCILKRIEENSPALLIPVLLLSLTLQTVLTSYLGIAKREDRLPFLVPHKVHHCKTCLCVFLFCAVPLAFCFLLDDMTPEVTNILYCVLDPLILSDSAPPLKFKGPYLALREHPIWSRITVNITRLLH